MARRATNPEDREAQLIAKAYRLAEKQIDEGTVSSLVLSQFIKLGTTRENLEKERVHYQAEMLRAKAEAIDADRTSGEKFEAAIAAMKRYQGVSDREIDDEVL